MRVFRQNIFLEARRVYMLLCDGKLCCGLAPRFRKISSSKILCFSSAVRLLIIDLRNRAAILILRACLGKNISAALLARVLPRSGFFDNF